MLRKLVRAGHLGVKTGKGFFEYDCGGNRVNGTHTAIKRRRWRNEDTGSQLRIIIGEIPADRHRHARGDAKGLVSRIGMADSVLTHKPWDRPEIKVSAEILDHIAAIEFVVSMLLSPNHGVIKDKSEIEAVGHRVVHGGEEFKDSVLITPELMSHLRALIELAPLHNPHNIRGINACQKTLPNIPQERYSHVLPLQHAAPCVHYGIPYLFYRRYGIRRYGFHGTSHKYVSDRAAVMLGKPLSDLKLITCHLGNGAFDYGVNAAFSIDTSMGFTPLEGF